MSDSRIREREGGSRRVGDTTRDQIVPDQVPPPPIEEPGKNQSRANPRGRGGERESAGGVRRGGVGVPQIGEGVEGREVRRTEDEEGGGEFHEEEPSYAGFLQASS
jgi:hypothetical protein